MKSLPEFTGKMTLTVKLICSSFSSVIVLLQACTRLALDKPLCEEPKTPFPYDACGWDYIDDTGGKLLHPCREGKS